MEEMRQNNKDDQLEDLLKDRNSWFVLPIIYGVGKIERKAIVTIISDESDEDDIYNLCNKLSDVMVNYILAKDERRN